VILSREQIETAVDDGLAAMPMAGKRVLLIVPDNTRTCPIDVMFEVLHARLAGTVLRLDCLIALGTHQPLSQDEIYRRMGITAKQHAGVYRDVQFFNHAWDDPGALMDVGAITKQEIHAWTDGMFEMDVVVTCNKMLRDYDTALILGPVFPHEVAGFSGGNKYLFPGVSGPEVLNFFHWLGALITNHEIIGTKWTPVRKVIDHAASMVPIDRRAFCMVVNDGGLAGLYAGTPEEAWSAAADHSARVHIRKTGRRFDTVLSCAPAMYPDLWTGGKCMYKLEPVVEDGGTLIIYAPHITEVSAVHGALLETIGYHTRDYFRAQWDRFSHVPWGVLAHSTHVKGAGSFVDGVETPRVRVELATGIPEATCRAINLGYRDAARIRPEDFAGREDEGVLLVERAGEILYRP
jgi:nickel-dependent lactate racemase